MITVKRRKKKKAKMELEIADRLQLMLLSDTEIIDLIKMNIKAYLEIGISLVREQTIDRV